MNKFLIKIGFLSLVLLIGVFSCTKEDLPQNSIENDVPLQRINLKKSIKFGEVNQKIIIKDGILCFDNLHQFLETLTSTSDTEKKNFPFEKMDKWEVENQFMSLRRDISINIEKNPNVDDIEFNDVSLNSLLNKNKLVIINGYLHYIDNDFQIIILDQSKEKLEKALKFKKSNERQGVYVIDRKELNLRGNCGTLQQNQKTVGKKKVAVKSWITTIASPVLNSSSILLGWNVGKRYNAMTESRKKNWFGHWKRHTTDLKWNVGRYETCTSGLGGAGWTAHVSRIDQNSVLWEDFVSGPLGGIPSCTFTAVWHHGENLQVANLKVSAECN